LARTAHSTHKPRTRARSSSPLARKPLVFISHDSRDGFLSKAFTDLLRAATGGALKTFCSSDARGTSGVEFGVEWFPTIIRKLEEATDVVVLLTPHSLDRSWIMFEAGVARGIGKAHIFGVTVEAKLDQTTSGPFYQFHNCEDNEDSLTDLVIQLIARNLDGEPLHSAVKAQVRDFRAKIEAWAHETSPPQPRTAGEDVSARALEEIKLIARDMRKNGNAKLLGPMLSEQFPLFPSSSKGEYDCTGWLILIGILRDELPWFFELGLELHRALSDGDVARIAGAKERLLASLYKAARNDWLRSTLADSNRELTFRLFHLPEIVEDYLSAIEPAKKAGTRAPNRRALRPTTRRAVSRPV
jgi:hypothetical protein